MEVGRAVVVAVCEKFCRRIRQTDLMPAAALVWQRRGRRHGAATGAWSGTNTLANCNKVKHDKIIKYIGKLTQERKFFENLPKSVEVTC